MAELRRRGAAPPTAAEALHERRERRAAQRPSRVYRACRNTAIFAVLLVALLLAGTVSAGKPLTHAGVTGFVNFGLMRLARDLSRVKARRRRFGQKHALMPVLFGREQPLPLGDASAGLALTLEELSEFDGRALPDSSERAPLYLALRGRIYDVSHGKAFYGPGRSYHKLVGKDATRAFCTGCLEPSCLIANTRGLSEAQLREADRWIELYEHHDKYKLIGQVREPQPAELADEGYADSAEEVEAEAERWEQEQVEAAQSAEASKKHKPFRPR